MTAVGNNALDTRTELKVGARTYRYYSLAKAAEALASPA
jgi:hypothetical protein